MPLLGRAPHAHHGFSVYSALTQNVFFTFSQVKPHESDCSSHFWKQLCLLCFQELPWLLVLTLAVTEWTPVKQIYWAHALLQVIYWLFLAEPVFVKTKNTE